MRFLRLPFLMVLIALAASLSPVFSFLLRFGAMALATLTLLGALSDMNGASKRADGMGRDDLLHLWFGGKLRERHTWEALTAGVTALASALHLPPPARPALPPPDPIANGRHTLTKGKATRKRQPAAELEADAPAEVPAAEIPPAEAPAETPRASLAPLLRILALEALSEALLIVAIVLNWFRPFPGTPAGEQLALLALGLLALVLLWFDWRLLRRFVAAVSSEVSRLAP